MTLTAGFGLPRATERYPTKRSYLLCPPTYFDVVYAINEWMHPEDPVDTARAMRQWEQLVRTYRALGHDVAIIDPVPGLPDMVFVTDSGLVVDGRVLGARYKTRQRAAEAQHVMRWFEANGFLDPRPPRFVNEGEGDFLVVGELILAGTGFRTDPRAHAEAAAHLRREVLTLNLVDPTYYHLNTALGVLDERTIAYLPRAFAPDSLTLLQERFPEAIVADEADTEWLGLNLVSDGCNVVLAAQATGLAEQLRDRGFVPVPVDFSEFRKSGGGIKCATLELRGVEHPSRHGVEHPNRHGAEHPSRHGVEHPNRHGAEHPSRHGVDNPNRHGAERQSRHGVEYPSRHGVERITGAERR